MNQYKLNIFELKRISGLIEKGIIIISLSIHQERRQKLVTLNKIWGGGAKNPLKGKEVAEDCLLKMRIKQLLYLTYEYYTIYMSSYYYHPLYPL